MTSRIVNSNSWRDRIGADQSVEFSKARAEYLAQFPYCVQVRLGKTHSTEFKDFYEWCSDRMGIRYKDWFIISSGKDIYNLYSRDNKWTTFLTLTWIDKIIT